MFSNRLVDAPLVLSWFVSELTDSNLLIGMVYPIGDAGWYLPQLFTSTRLQNVRKKMPTYAAAAALRIICWGLLTCTVFLAPSPQILLAWFFLLYTIGQIAWGVGGVPFFDVLAKTVRAEKRGYLFAWRQLLGGLIGILAGWLVSLILKSPELLFPMGHAMLFAVHALTLIPAELAFVRIREPPGVIPTTRLTIRKNVSKALKLLKSSDTYRRYILVRFTQALSGMAIPFYGIYGKVVLRAPDGLVGIYIIARVAAQLVFNLPWGAASAKFGNRIAMRLWCLGNGIMALAGLSLITYVSILEPVGSWLPYLLIPIFIIDGMVRPAHALSGSNYLIELVSEEDRPLHLGLSNTLIAIAILLSGLGGVLVDMFGYAGLFAFSLAISVIGFVMSKTLPEPRHDTRRICFVRTQKA